MSKKQAPQDKQEQAEKKLLNVEKGVGGEGRVAGLLADDKAQDIQGALKRLLANLAAFKWQFILALTLTLIASLAQVLAPRLVGQIITLVTRTLRGGTEIDWKQNYRMGLLLAGLYLLNFVATYIANITMVQVTQKVIKSLRIQMQGKLNRVTLSYFDQSSSGDLVSLLTNDLDNVASTLQTGLTSSITALVMMVGVLVMMLSIEPMLAILTLVIVPVAYYLVQILVKRAKPIFQRTAQLTGEFNGQITQAYEGQDIVDHYGLKDELKADLAQLNEALYESEWRSSYVSYMTRPAGDLILNGNYVLVAIVGGWKVIQGLMTIGDFQAFIAYTKMFSGPFQQVLGIMNTLMSALASAERIFRFLDAPEIVELGDKELDIDHVAGHIQLDQVEFAYVPDQPLFQAVNLDVTAGQQLAIVGTTGAGKTTLVNLLMRFYEVDGGSISLDGVPITDYSVDQLRKAFGMVLQDTWLFAGTIRENIAYGAQVGEDPDLSTVPMETIQRAAQLARADNFIERLPDQYETVLTEGASNISNGQRQLLTIARAIIKGAPIIILDEATSSVDTRTELLIQQGMGELTSNRTSFVIAHRLSTIHNADLIIVMDQGTIVETGTHGELLDLGGHYAELYAAGQTE